MSVNTASFPRQPAAGTIYTVISEIIIGTNDIIQLQASNGMYLTIEQALGLNMITASGQQSDQNAQFQIKDVENFISGSDGSLFFTCRLYSSAVGQYLSRFDISNTSLGYLAACKATADQYTALSFTFLLSFASPQVASVIIQADNGQVYGLNPASGVNYIRAIGAMTSTYAYVFSDITNPVGYEQVEVVPNSSTK